MTHVDLVDGVAHVYVESPEGHRPAADCPCHPSTPLISHRLPPELAETDLYVHRPIRPGRVTVVPRQIVATRW